MYYLIKIESLSYKLNDIEWGTTMSIISSADTESELLRVPEGATASDILELYSFSYRWLLLERVKGKLVEMHNHSVYRKGDSMFVVVKSRHKHMIVGYSDYSRYDYDQYSFMLFCGNQRTKRLSSIFRNAAGVYELGADTEYGPLAMPTPVPAVVGLTTDDKYTSDRKLA